MDTLKKTLISVQAGMQQCQFLCHRAQGWYWRMQGILSWLWENHDDVNYCSCPCELCLLCWVFARRQSHSRYPTAWRHWWQWSPSAELCLQAVLAQPRGCTLVQRGVRKPEAPVTSSGTVFCLLTCPRTCCKGRHIKEAGDKCI